MLRILQAPTVCEAAMWHQIDNWREKKKGIASSINSRWLVYHQLSVNSKIKTEGGPDSLTTKMGESGVAVATSTKHRLPNSKSICSSGWFSSPFDSTLPFWHEGSVALWHFVVALTRAAMCCCGAAGEQRGFMWSECAAACILMFMDAAAIALACGPCSALVYFPFESVVFFFSIANAQNDLEDLFTSRSLVILKAVCYENAQQAALHPSLQSSPGWSRFHPFLPAGAQPLVPIPPPTQNPLQPPWPV